MTGQGIKELLLYGESIHLECKECRVDIPKSVWETYSSFANTYGGVILLGVHEDVNEPDMRKRFTIAGVSDKSRVIGNFWNTINGDKTNVNILKDENVYAVDVDGKGRWTMYQVNKNYLESTAQDTAQDTGLKNSDIQNTAQDTAQDTAQEKSLRKIHQEKLIIAFCKEPHTLKEIAAHLKYKNTRWLREVYINPLLGTQLWMTIPDAPTSGNQKYTSIPPKE